MIGMWSDRQLADVPQNQPVFLVNWHGWFPRAIWDNPAARFFHVIRDPRGVLLSGWQYHQTAGPKGEKFLHTERADLSGKTYQQALNSIEKTDDQILFEMREKHAVTVQEMLDWPYDDPRQITLRYEDLMQDGDCSLFKSALQHLGFDQARQGHVQSGAISRWASELPQAVGATYEQEYGTALKRLGYSENSTWVDELSVEFTQKAGSIPPEEEINR